jgi:ubiquinone/menaquinone biosynthesis C-methylase UbiE
MKSHAEEWIEDAGIKFLEDVGLRSGQKVLDFGCGSGNYTIPAAMIVGESGLVYALDKDRTTLGELIRKAESMGLKNIVRLDASKEPGIALGNESVDVVLLCDVLHYYYFPQAEDRSRLLREVCRVLKPDALLLLCPMHLQSYMEPNLEEVQREIQEASFYLERENTGTIMVHGNNLENTQVMNFRKVDTRAR